MSRDDTSALLVQARNGDRHAFDALAGRVRPRLEAFVGKRLAGELRGRLSAADVCQETILRAWTRLDRFEPRQAGVEACFFSWLCGVAVRVLLEESHRQRQAPLRLDFEVRAEDQTASRIFARKERWERLEAAIRLLPPDYGAVIRLVMIDGLRVKEVARQWDRTPNAVSQLLLRALRRLRQDFGDTGSLSLK